MDGRKNNTVYIACSMSIPILTGVKTKGVTCCTHRYSLITIVLKLVRLKITH